VPQIEVTFDIDANGIVNVTAKDKATNKEQKITITSSSGLAKDEVDRMMREAESHADEDKRKKEEIELRNQADQAVYAAEKFVKDNADKVSADVRGTIDSALATLKGALEKNDPNAIKQGLEALMSAQHRAAEEMYRGTGGPGGAQPESPGPSGEGQSAPGGAGDGVIDAEVVDEGK
jgi:molecular chaperone DnaK